MGIQRQSGRICGRKYRISETIMDRFCQSRWRLIRFPVTRTFIDIVLHYILCLRPLWAFKSKVGVCGRKFRILETIGPILTIEVAFDSASNHYNVYWHSPGLYLSFSKPAFKVKVGVFMGVHYFVFWKLLGRFWQSRWRHLIRFPVTRTFIDIVLHYILCFDVHCGDSKTKFALQVSSTAQRPRPGGVLRT